MPEWDEADDVQVVDAQKIQFYMTIAPTYLTQIPHLSKRNDNIKSSL